MEKCNWCDKPFKRTTHGYGEAVIRDQDDRYHFLCYHTMKRRQKQFDDCNCRKEVDCVCGRS